MDYRSHQYFGVQSLGKYAVPCIKSLSFNNICTFNSSHAFQHYVSLIFNNIFVQYFLLDGVCAISKQVLKSLQRDVCPLHKRGGGWWGLMGGGGGDVGGGVVIHFESRLRNLRIFPRPLSSHSPWSRADFINELFCFYLTKHWQAITFDRT